MTAQMFTITLNKNEHNHPSIRIKPIKSWLSLISSILFKIRHTINRILHIRANRLRN